MEEKKKKKRKKKKQNKDNSKEVDLILIRLQQQLHPQINDFS